MESFCLIRSGRGIAVALLGSFLVGGCVAVPQGTDACLDKSEEDSLAANMASMEVHLNRLFRQFGGDTIDEHSEESASALLSLQRESISLVPEAWCELPESERSVKIDQYTFRALQMVELLEDLLAFVKDRDLELAKKGLETIDRYRRECHVRFG